MSIPGFKVCFQMGSTCTPYTEASRAALTDGESENAGFPYIKTTKLNYDPELPSWLSQLSSWTIMQSMDVINAALGEAA